MPLATRSAGFTLIEIAVVLLIMTIILAMVGLKLGGDDVGAVRQESERLALLMQTAQQEAILQGQVLAVALDTRGYQFLELNADNEFKPLTQDDILRPRQLPQGMTVKTVAIDGVNTDQDTKVNTQSEQDTTSGRDTKLDQNAIILFPTGELTAFRVTLAQHDARWNVAGSVNGEIKPMPQG